MTATFPYVNAPGPLITFLGSLRNKFPTAVTVETLKKLGLAAQNESYVINTLQFLDLIGENGESDGEKTKFFRGSEEIYKKGMEQAVRKAYHDLFDTHGEKAWTLPRSDLVTFFRMSDGTSEIVGARQASTFEVLAAQTGKRETTTAPRSSSPKPNGKSAAGAAKPVRVAERTSSGMEVGPKVEGHRTASLDLGLSVRIELTLPSTDDPKVYDALFKSMRENLIEPYRI